MRIHILTILAALSLLATSCMKEDMFEGLFSDSVAVSGTVIDSADDSPIAGITVTLNSYDKSDKTAIKASAECTTDKYGRFALVIDHNDFGDYFRVVAKDPAGVYKQGGIDYIEWDGKVNLLSSQNIILSK